MSEEIQPSEPIPWGGLGCFIFVLALLLPGPLKSVDVIYSASYMVAHWNDTEAFPPGAQFCKKWFCMRTDTVEKHVTGSEGYTSEETMYFCPIHDPPLALTFFHEYMDFGALDLWIFLPFWGLTFLGVWLIFGLAMLMITEPVRVVLPGEYRLPWRRLDEDEPDSAAGSVLNKIVLTASVALTAVAAFFYSLW